MNYVGRFAPSPTGNLHLGTLVAALGSWLRARQQAGRWLVRIDDIDPSREHPGASERILAGLELCGLVADQAPLYQSTRIQAYQRALSTLQAQGRVFECWCSRRDLADAGQLHRDGRCLRGPDPGRPPAMRLAVEPGEIAFDDVICGPVREDVRETVGDFVLRRADGCWSYHLACAMDEPHMGITEVIRGHDLLPSTARQILIQRLLRLPSPAYGHLPLVMGSDGEKLSKSGNGPELDLSDPATSLRNALVHLGQTPPPARCTTVTSILQTAVAGFDLAAIPVATVAGGA
ncbi:MAG: tRNA glutamyl-Q(34) synthetase GluQRS [Rhodanobacteraceae bacterium]